MRLLLVCLLLSLVPSAFGQYVLGDEVLKGIKEFEVNVFVDEELVRYGLTVSAVTTAVELRLRSLGLPVSKSTFPYLHVSMSGTCNENSAICALSLAIQFRHKVLTIEYEAPILTVGSIWNTGSVLLYGTTTLPTRWKEALIEDVDKFANAFLAQNPKK